MEVDTSHHVDRSSRPSYRLQTDDPALVSYIDCYRWSPLKAAIFVALSLLSLGLLPLFVVICHFKGFRAAFIRLSHTRCSLDQVTVFLAKMTFRHASVVCHPVLIAANHYASSPLLTDSSLAKGETYKTLTPVNRPLLSFWQKIFFKHEFVNEKDSASPFKVHIDQHQGDSLHAGVNLGDCGMFFWNTDRQIFQRLETPPPYFCHRRRRSSGGATFIESCEQTPEQMMANILDVKIYQQNLAANDANFIIELFRLNVVKCILFAFCTVISGGLLACACTWKPTWRLFLTCDRVDFANSHLATYVKMTDATLPNDNVWIRKLWLSSRRGVLLENDKHFSEMPMRSQLTWRFFIFESMPFVLDARCNRFVPGPLLLDELVNNLEAPPSTSGDFRHPWSRRVLCGFNVTPVPKTPLWLIIWHEAFTPLYLFQFGCCVMWFCVDYRIYAICLIVFSFCTIAWSVYMTYSNERAVWHAVVGEGERENEVDKQKVTIISGQDDDITRYSTNVDARKLLPGDVVFLEPITDEKGALPDVPADLVLIRGSCFVDESMLSGEVTPVSKFACAKLMGHDERPLERNIVHSGTKLLSLSPATVGMVLTIGFNTTRGRLVRAVLRPTPADRRFTVEAVKFLLALGIIGFLGLLYSLIIRALRQEDGVLIFVMCIVLISIIIPPQTSVGLTIAQVIAQVRLKAKRIFCTSPKSITPTGSVDLVCFDKTGTLTEESVKLKDVISVQEGNTERPLFSDEISYELELCAGCCNSVTLLPQSPHAEAVNMPIVPVGDPIDVELLEFSQFCLVSNGLYASVKRPGVKIEMVKNFGFSPERRSSCVIARVTKLSEESLVFFLKGAPEHVLVKCVPSSIPENISQVVDDAATKGLRLIVLASKMVTFDQIDYDLESLESNMKLLGISFFENALKPQSRPTIRKLQKANLRTLMITGDDVRTALATARQCGIVTDGGEGVMTIHEISEQSALSQLQATISAASFIQLCSSATQTRKQLAITEEAWQILKTEAALNVAGSNALNHFLERAAVFARFRPDQKAEVISAYRKRFGFVVAMVGDGANDCCALKTADVGIALTEAEASIASAFTCKDRNISPVIDIIKEGRCSLTSTFGLFGVMVSYSCVQFTSACLLYWIQANCTDLQFLYIDLFLLTTLSLVFPMVPAFHGAISTEQPNRRLLSFGQIAPIMAHNAVNAGFQILIFLYVQQQAWFLPYNMPQDATNFTIEFNSFEAFSLYTIAIFQYLSSAFIFARGAPFRSSFFRSRVFTAHLVVLFVVNHFIVLYLPECIRRVLKTFPPPSVEFRIIIVLLAYINFASCLLVVRAVQELVRYFKSMSLKKKVSVHTE